MLFLPLLLVAGAASNSALPCTITVPMTDATKIDVGGSILGLGLHLGEPRGGASASGSVILTLPGYKPCPNWAGVRDSELFWASTPFSINATIQVVPSDIVIKAGSIPINVKDTVAIISSSGTLNSTADGFEGAGAMRILSGNATAMGHFFDLRSKQDNPLTMKVRVAACSRAPNIELVLSLTGSFQSDDLPGSKSHVDLIASIVAISPNALAGSSSLETISPTGGAWDVPTRVTISGNGLINAEGTPVALKVRSPRGQLVACEDVRVYDPKVAQREKEAAQKERELQKKEEERKAEESKNDDTHKLRRRLFAAAVHARQARLHRRARPADRASAKASAAPPPHLKAAAAELALERASAGGNELSENSAEPLSPVSDIAEGSVGPAEPAGSAAARASLIALPTKQAAGSAAKRALADESEHESSVDYIMSDYSSRLSSLEKRGHDDEKLPSGQIVTCVVPAGLPGETSQIQLATGAGCGAKRLPFVTSDSPCGNAQHAGCLLLAHGAFNVSDCSCACQEGFYGARCEMCEAGEMDSCGGGATCLGGDFKFFRGELSHKSYECTPAEMPIAFGSLAVTVECSGRSNAHGQGTCRLQVGGSSIADMSDPSAIVCEATGCTFLDGSASASCKAVNCDMGRYADVIQSLIGTSTIQGSIAFNCQEPSWHSHAQDNPLARCVLTVSDLPIPISADCYVSECVADHTLHALHAHQRRMLAAVIFAGLLTLFMVVLLPIIICVTLRRPHTLAQTEADLAHLGAKEKDPGSPVRRKTAELTYFKVDETDGFGASEDGELGAAKPTSVEQATAELLAAELSAAASNRMIVSELRFDQLSVTAANGREILKCVSGTAVAGELLGVMGPSGSGKTTLLDLIAGQPPAGAKTGGQALLDGMPLQLGASYPPSLIAYCQQNDLLPTTLSVLECVSLAAMLTLPAEWTRAAKLRRAIDAIEEVGLTHVADSIIGDANTVSVHGRVSGGERRRISLAMALVASPAILLCDEVTSGLDSTTAYSMVRTLRALARRGRIIILSIHQPSSRAFLGLDRLALMRGGELVLAAPTNQLARVCEQAGVPCASGFNLADHLLDVLAADDEMRVVSARLGQHTTWVPIDPEAYEARVGLARAANRGHPATRAARQGGCARLRVELRSLFWRAAVSVVRHPSLLRLHLFVAVASATAVGGLFHGLGNDVSGLQNRIGAVFFVLALFGFSGLSAMEVFMGESALSLREMRNGYYGLPLHLISKLSIDALLLRVVPACAFCAVFYPLANFDTSTEHVVYFFVIATLVNVAAGTLVAALSVPFDSLGSANLCATIVMLVLLLLNGALLNLKSAPIALQALQDLSFFRFGFEALLGNELHNKVIMVDAPGVESFPLSANLFLALLGIDPTRQRRDMMVLLAFALSHGLLAGLLLLWKIRRPGSCTPSCKFDTPKALAKTEPVKPEPVKPEPVARAQPPPVQIIPSASPPPPKRRTSAKSAILPSPTLPPNSAILPPSPPPPKRNTSKRSQVVKKTGEGFTQMA